MSRLLTSILTSQNYAVEVATHAQSGLSLVEAFDYDLIVIDVMLPDLDGVSLCRQIRSKELKMPILLLTGRDSSHEKAIGLDAGADDYVVKPFAEEELVARIRALLRRVGTITPPILKWGDLHFDPSSCEVTYQGSLISLTPKEYALLELFLRNNRRVFSCGMILEHLWSYEELPGEDAVRTHIKGLRQKLKAAGVPSEVIETVYGIGYRLKRLEFDEHPANEPRSASPNAQSGSSNPDPKAQQQTLEAVNQLWYEFRAHVNEQVGVLNYAVCALEEQKLDPNLRQKARQEAHTLAGTLGTFGFPEGSQIARQMEHQFESNAPLHPNDTLKMRTGVTELLQLLERSKGGFLEELNSTSEADVKTTQHQPLLLIVDRDLDLTQKLQVEAKTWGFRVQIATSLRKARDQMRLELPDVVLLDLATSSLTGESSLWLTELSKQAPPIPVIILTEEDDLTQRLDVARLGGRTFVQKLTSPAQVLETVNQVLNQAERAKAGVMVVDDDPVLLAIVRSLLEPWGLKVTPLSNPHQFWDVLESTTPDLLILDIEMPQISGIELCQIVRQDARWSSLPILFLTSHTDAETVNEVFSIGADDFVSKPIVGPELVTRIINRLERIRFLRSLADTDLLTKVATRQKSTQEIETYLRLAKRQNQPFCLAILDLDHFKRINDDYGHATGDEVLYQIGKLLRRSFRNEDVVARWGGEEFVVGLYGSNKQDGIQRLSKVLQALHQKSFMDVSDPTDSPEPSSPFQVTFSAGVAQYPQDGIDLHTLYQAADVALYQAKASGRDRVLGTSD